MDVGPEDQQIGFPIPKAGRHLCVIGTPSVKDSKKGTPMYVFPLLPVTDIPCTSIDRETGERKEIQYGNGKPCLTYYASLSPEALRYGSIGKIEMAAKKKGSLWPSKGTFTPENLPQFAGLRVFAQVVNTNDPGTNETRANVNDVFPA